MSWYSPSIFQNLPIVSTDLSENIYNTGEVHGVLRDRPKYVYTTQTRSGSAVSST